MALYHLVVSGELIRNKSSENASAGKAGAHLRLVMLACFSAIEVHLEEAAKDAMLYIGVGNFHVYPRFNPSM